MSVEILMQCTKHYCLFIKLWQLSRKFNCIPVMVSPERLDTCPLAHVPDPDRLILRSAKYQILSWMEITAGDIVIVASA